MQGRQQYFMINSLLPVALGKRIPGSRYFQDLIFFDRERKSKSVKATRASEN